MACQDYYIPPPPVAVTISSPLPTFGNNFVTLPLATQNPTTNVISTEQQEFTASVLNTNNTAVTWSIVDPVDGSTLPNGNLPDGTAPWGRIDSSGLYTAPATLPTPNTFAVQATSKADTTQSGQVGIQLQSPTAIISSVSVLSPNGQQSIAAMTQGGSYLLDVKGTFLYPGATVTLSGGSAGTPQFAAGAAPPLNEFQVAVTDLAAGMLPLKVLNPSSAPGNPYILVSQPQAPASSSTLADLIEPEATIPGAATQLVNKIYVPQAASNSLALINGDAAAPLRNSTGQAVRIFLPVGYAPSGALANPNQNQVVVYSATSGQIYLVDAIRDSVSASYSVAVSGTAKFPDQTCGICAGLVDSTRNLAIFSTAGGFITVNLATGKAAAPLAAPTAENFAYDPATQTVYAPYIQGASAGLSVLDLAHGVVRTFQLPAGAGFNLGATLTAAALDPTTMFGIVADRATSQYTGINWNASAVAGNTVSAPAAQFQISPNCGGNWESATLEPSTHFGFFGNNAGCVGVASLPSAPATGVMTLPNYTPPGTLTPQVNIRWAQLGAGPDGVAWANASPSSLITFVGVNGAIYGAALRADGRMLVRVDLRGLQNAPQLTGGADANQVEITATPLPVAFIPIPGS